MQRSVLEETKIAAKIGVGLNSVILHQEMTAKKVSGFNWAIAIGDKNITYLARTPDELF